MRYLIVLLLAGCVSPALRYGNTCIPDGFGVGREIQHVDTGSIGKVTRLYGKSERCIADSHPILADVEYTAVKQ